MDLTGEGVGVYAEAKGEYTKQLCQYMLPALQQYFIDMMEDAKQKEPVVNKVLLQFQQLLENVPEWNVDKVQRETTALATATHCDYLEELLTAVFIAHTKVLSAIRLTTRQKKLQITIPRLEHFLHRTLTECSRLLWSNTYLFSTSAPSIERQKNHRLIESILHDGIQQAIRGMLPVKNILREYLREDAEDEEKEEEEKEEEEEAKEEAKEAKEEAKEAKETKEVKEAKEAKATSDVSGAELPVFTGIDTVFEEKEPVVEDFEAEKFIEEEVQILEGVPEPMDEFEDLDAPKAESKSESKSESKAEPEKEEELQMDFEELA
jgi:hypothetical protein